MKYSINSKVLEGSVSGIEKYEYALIYYFSKTVLDKTTDILNAGISWDDVKEAYFFSEGRQLHIVNIENRMHVIEFEANSTSFVEKKYVLNAHHQSVGKAVIVREYLDVDEDGQCFVGYTGLTGIC